MKRTTSSVIESIKSIKKEVLLITVIVIITLTVSITVSTLLNDYLNFTVSSHGNIKTTGVEVYWDHNLSNQTKTINWNELWFGTSEDVTVYIRSVSNYDVKLSVQSTDWSPTELSEYMMLSWDYKGQPVKPNEVIKVKITLKSDYSTEFINFLVKNDVKNFDFNVNFIAI